MVSEFWVNKYKDQAARNWDLFYKRNSDHFFKDRHWTDREFPELQPENLQNKILLELGCGVGNFLLPILTNVPTVFIHACDFSSRAIDIVQKHPSCDLQRCHAFVCDLTTDDLPKHVSLNSINVASAIFVLSALPFEKMPIAVKNVFEVLKPGGVVLFRDYGLYDLAQLRFKPGHKLEENFYVRQDGTLAYYFSLEVLKNLFEKMGFETVEASYVFKEIVNRKQEVKMERIFVQAKFRKPL